MNILAVATEVVVTNQPVGSELLLLSAGYVCGAIAWRMIMGRW